MPFRAARSTRSGRPGAPNDADVFDGLPVRQWRRHEQTIGIVEEDQPTSEGPQAQGPMARDVTPEPPMPKGSEFYTPWCRELLRLARSEKVPQKTNKAPSSNAVPKKASSDKENAGQPSSDDKEVDAGFGSRGTKRAAEQGFPALRWGLVPRALEEPERERLAKRRKGLPPLHAAVHLNANVPMRKTKVKRTDADGQSTVFEVMVPEDQTVEGEIKEEITLENAGAAIAAPKPGTFVEGLGVTNEQGVVIASEGIAPLRRKGPVAFRRKKKKGPGRWQQKLSDMTTGGVSASAEALEERKRREQEASRKVEGLAEGDKEENHDAEEDDEGESGEDAEEGDDDDDREEGELSPDGKQDGNADDTMLLDEELPLPSEAPQTSGRAAGGSARSIPSDAVPTLAVETAELKRPRIPGLTVNQNVTDAAVDVHDEPAPDKNVPPTFETPTTNAQTESSINSPNDRPEMTKDSISGPNNEVHPMPSAVDSLMQDVGSSATDAGRSAICKDNTSEPPTAETRSTERQVVADDATTFQPLELMVVVDDQTSARAISPRSNFDTVQPGTPDPRPSDSNRRGTTTDDSAHSAVHNDLGTTADDQVLRDASPGTHQPTTETPATSDPEQQREAMIPIFKGHTEGQADPHQTLHVTDRYSGLRAADSAAFESHEHVPDGHAIRITDTGHDDYESDTDRRGIQARATIPQPPVTKVVDTTLPPHPEDIPFIPSMAHDSIAPIVDPTTPPAATTADTTTSHQADPTNPTSDLGLSTEALSPHPEHPSFPSSQSPQRPETEALTPEPDDVLDGIQQGDVHFEDGDVDLLGSAEGRG